jgi:hypothetical protein
MLTLGCFLLLSSLRNLGFLLRKMSVLWYEFPPEFHSELAGEQAGCELRTPVFCVSGSATCGRGRGRPQTMTLRIADGV